MPATPDLQTQIDVEGQNLMAFLQTADNKANDVEEKTKVLGTKLEYYLLRSRTIATFIFNLFTQTAELQLAQTMLHVAMTGVSIARTITQASIAFGSGNPIEGAYLMVLAGTMAANQSMALMEQERQKAQQQQIENMRNYFESYSG